MIITITNGAITIIISNTDDGGDNYHKQLKSTVPQ